MSFPLPEKKNDKSGELTENESEFILKSTLREKHFNDPKVVGFINSFVRCQNITEASADVGVHPSVGFKWRHRADISKAIRKVIEKCIVKHGFDGSQLLQRLLEKVEFDPLDAQNPDGTWKTHLSEMLPGTRKQIKKMKVKNLYKEAEDMNGLKTKIIVGEIIDIEFKPDDVKSIELLGREKEMFKQTTKVQHDVTEDMANVLLASKQLADKHSGPIEPVTVDVDFEVVK